MELHHLIKEGVPPLLVWYGATGGVAKCYQLSNIGTLRAGNIADIIICKGDSINHPESLGERF